MLKGLRAVILERFQPASYLPMIVVFTAVNGLYGHIISGLPYDLARLICAGFLILSAFFRLRLFDEIKDYETDLRINPTRPLARGAITIPQVKVTIAVLILFELIFSASLGLPVFLVHALATGYSLLMFEEFFIGNWLRPHLTTYAITHTFVSVLFGISVAFAANAMTLEFHASSFVFFLFNWAFFNLFEFARKTYAPTEERKGVDTYSSLFGALGAALLSASQVLVGVLLEIRYFPGAVLTLLIPAAIYSIFILLYAAKPVARNARLFRAVTGIYLIVNYVLLTWMMVK